MGYKIRLGSEVLGKMRSKNKFEYKVTDYGKKEFWARTEIKKVLEIDIEKGKEYYVRCSIGSGIFLLRPKIHLTENHIGIKEFEETGQRKARRKAKRKERREKR